MPEFRFRRDFRVEIVQPDTVFLLSERAQHVLNGSLYARLAPLLDGGHDFDAICAALADSSPAQLRYAISRLRQQGYLQTESPPQPAASVSIVGERCRAELSAILRALDLRVVDADADLTFVLVEDDLDPSLADINRAMLASGRAWLLVKPVGSVIWIGPLFTPDHACWECLAQRLRANRPVEAFIRHRTHQPEPITPPQPANPASVAAALHLAVTAALQWLDSDVSPLQDRLLTFDTLTFRSDQHVVVKRPQCLACGDPQPAPPQPLQLTSRPKFGAMQRSADTAETYARCRHHVSPITGAVSQLSRVPSLGSLHVYSAGANKSRPYDLWQGTRATLRSHNAGKGTDDLQARVSGLCESLERYSGLFQGDEPRRSARYVDFDGDAVHPRDLLLFSDRQYAERDQWNPTCPQHLDVPEPFDHQQMIDWSPVWSLTESRFKYVPTAYAYFGLTVDFCTPDSNGNAAGSSLEDAVIQGFMELVERDAVAIWWYNRLPRPALDFDHPYLDEVRAFYGAHHREIWLLDLTTDLQIPTCVALSRRIDKPAEDIIMGFGAHFDPQVAALRALTEMNQMLTAVLSLDYTGTLPQRIALGDRLVAARDPRQPALSRAAGDVAPHRRVRPPRQRRPARRRADLRRDRAPEWAGSADPGPDPPGHRASGGQGDGAGAAPFLEPLRARSPVRCARESRLARRAHRRTQPQSPVDDPMSVEIRLALHRAGFDGALAIQTDHSRLSLGDASPSLLAALRLLENGVSESALRAPVAGRDAARLSSTLRQLIGMGRIRRTLYADDQPVAAAIPLAPGGVQLAPVDSDTAYILSRFAYLRRDRSGMVIESPLSRWRIDWLAPGELYRLADLYAPDDLTRGLRDLLAAAGMLTLDQPDDELPGWKFHDRLFLAKIQRAASDYPAEPPALPSNLPPPVKPPMSDRIIPLDRPNLDALRAHDPPFTAVLESRRSIRAYGETPISLQELGEFLYRAARVQRFIDGDYPATLRPSPSAGALHVLEIYPVVARCDGLDAGLYHYDPARHGLEPLTADPDQLAAMLDHAAAMTGDEVHTAQVLLLITARFGRIQWKYTATALSLVLNDLGSLYQTFYLVATAMQLAPCAVGSLNPQTIALAEESIYDSECSVGEFLIGK